MFTAIILSTAVALTPPVAIDLDGLKSGNLPEAGTIEEADACALVTTYGYMQARAIMKGDDEKDRKAAEIPRAWMARAAAFRSVTSERVYQDKSFEKALLSLRQIDMITQFRLYQACTTRTVG